MTIGNTAIMRESEVAGDLAGLHFTFMLFSIACDGRSDAPHFRNVNTRWPLVSPGTGYRHCLSLA